MYIYIRHTKTNTAIFIIAQTLTYFSVDSNTNYKKRKNCTFCMNIFTIGLIMLISINCQVISVGFF